MNPESNETREALLEDLLVKTSRTFALSIPPLPEPLRSEVTIAYLLFRIADTDGNGKFSNLRDDEGFWHPRRKAVEGDLVNAVRKPLDDDNQEPVAELYRAAGFSEQGLLASLVEAMCGLFLEPIGPVIAARGETP